jgi:hypothetical protein
MQTEHNTKLYRSYLCESPAKLLIRHRGKSPQQAGFFMRTARARQEATVLASLCCLVGALPLGPAPELLSSLPSLGRGELLCHAYGVYRILMPESMISFEHAVFLLTAELPCKPKLTWGRTSSCRCLLETEWVLRSRYDLAKTDLVATFSALLDTSDLVVDWAAARRLLSTLGPKRSEDSSPPSRFLAKGDRVPKRNPSLT